MKKVVIQIGERRYRAEVTSDVIPCEFCELPVCLNIPACNQLIGYSGYFKEVPADKFHEEESLPILRSRVDDDSEYINE